MLIKYSPLAIADLIEIGDYYRGIGGNQLSIRMIKQIRRDVNKLINYTAPNYELVIGIRRLVVANGAFLVFHRIMDTAIEVVHVRRSERAPATKKDID